MSSKDTSSRHSTQTPVLRARAMRTALSRQALLRALVVLSAAMLASACVISLDDSMGGSGPPRSKPPARTKGADPGALATAVPVDPHDPSAPGGTPAPVAPDVPGIPDTSEIPGAGHSPEVGGETRATPTPRRGERPAPKTRPKVYRNSKDYEFLSEGGRIVPGAKYSTKAGSCSFGWFVEVPNGDGRIFNLTAGHCGNAGDAVYVRGSGGRDFRVGTFVETFYDRSAGQDWALIDMSVRPDAFNPPVEISMVELRGIDELDTFGGYVCALGWRSGLTCGDYSKKVGDYLFEHHGIRDHGDSGGAVWVYEPRSDPAHAVGVVSAVVPADAAVSYSNSVSPALKKFGVTLLRDQR